ncbi:uncharacterized protein LOC132577996 [Heteronotia binoei]|uniref:uncharacterized protein LOC132577996 n=1 Tax=Heteronotia binoei TaxID=13085 RepID=UPI00292FD526|nr:uncharacterized protein LOC132577996 [Heteronotia binoei]
MSAQNEAEQPEAEQPEPEKPKDEQPELEKPGDEQPESEKPGDEQPEPEKLERPGSRIYYCEICKVPCLSAIILQTHFAGIRHKKRERALKRKCAPPVINEEPMYVKRPLSKSIRCLKDYMKDPNREEPLIGLEYVLEVQFQGRRDPCYECQLCMFKTEIVPMIEHLIGQRHRKAYIIKHYPDKGKRKANDPKEDRARFFRRIAREIEKEEGLKMYKVRWRHQLLQEQRREQGGQVAVSRLRYVSLILY